VYAHDLTGDEVLTRYLYGSSLNIQGVYSGYTGPGSRTYTIPHEATALLDARLLTPQSTDEVIAGLLEHLDEAGFPDVQLTVKGAYPASSTPPDAPLVRSFLDAAGRAGGRPVVWPRSGGGGPWSIFNHRFGAPVVFGTGIGTGGNPGGVDEYLVLDGGGKQPGLPEMQRFCVDLITDFAARKGNR
jgi:acetylornithine deacetylase/succinyl-diaminopimelate desuccinylase-like protein